MKNFMYLLMGFAFAGSVNATIIDFESAATGGCQVSAGGSTGGFTLGAYDGDSGAGFNNKTSCSYLAPTANSGNNYMVNFNNVTGEFTKDSGVFDLDSVYVVSDIRSGDSTVRFQGLDGVDGNLLYTMDVAITTSWNQVVFSGWDDVKTFTWDSLVPDVSNIAIDDFEYDAYDDCDPIPEPSILALLGFSLVGIGISRRKRHA